MLKLNVFTTTTTAIITIYIFFQRLSIANGLSINEYCRFDEDLKENIRNLECNGDIDDCAGEVRQLVQAVYAGSWGVVIVADKKDIKDEKVEWFINSIDPKPHRCRMIVDENIVIEIFRTGYREMEIVNDQRHWLWRKAKHPDFESDNELDLCPHSALRQIITMFSIKAHSQMAEVRHRHGVPSLLHSAAKSIADVFYTETSHHWNIFITKNDDDFPINIGYNIPHYIYDSQSGFCIGKTRDGYTINAAIIGFKDLKEEIMSIG